MIALILAALTTPYQAVTVPDGSNARYVVQCGDPNAGMAGPISFYSALSAGGWFRYVYNSFNGWNGEGQLDPSVENVWVQPLSRQPFGNVDSMGRIWPDEDGAITIYTNRSTLDVTVYGSPCESVRLVGNDNVLTVRAYSGEQSLFKLGRPAVHVLGDRNTVTGYAEHPMCALYVRGNDTTVKNFEAVGGSVGDDTGMIYFQGYERDAGGAKILGYHTGATIRNVKVRQSGRWYAPTHGTNAVYFDDGFSRAKVDTLDVYGYFTRPVFANGGTGISTKRVRTYN